MKKQLEYIEEGRSGYIIYKEGQSRITFFFEYGGGNCVAIIYIPAIHEWENKTKRPLADRETIVRFVAEQCVKDKAPACTYILSDNCIELF